MENINTKSYWNKRFKSDNWSKAGRFQTTQYAKGNIKHIDISPEFTGSILDFGCALGDAIQVYKQAYPRAKLFGIDISDEAIKICKERYGDIAEFGCGGYDQVNEKDVIIASHVMEHLTDDRSIVKSLLSKCRLMYVIVPYKENPLYREHVNYYEEDYYEYFDVLKKSTFTISYTRRKPTKGIIKSLILLKPEFTRKFSKKMILFKIKGTHI